MKLYTSGASSLGDSLRTVEKDTSLPLRSGLFTELSKQWAGPGYGIRSDLMTSHEPAPLRRVRSTPVGPLAHPPTERKEAPHVSRTWRWTGEVSQVLTGKQQLSRPPRLSESQRRRSQHRTDGPACLTLRGFVNVPCSLGKFRNFNETAEN